MEQEELIFKKYDSTVMKRLLHYLKPHRKSVTIVIFSLLFAMLFELVTPLVIQKSIDNYIILQDDETFITAEQRIEGVWHYVKLFALLLTGSFGFTFLQVFFSVKTGQLVMIDIRNQLMSHILGQSLAYMQKKPVGSLVSRITSDVETINELFTNVATSLLKNSAIMVGVLVLLFIIHPLLAAITLATLIPVLFLTLFFQKFARNAFRKVREGVSRINVYLSEHLGGIEIIQLFCQEKRCRKEFSSLNSGLYRGRRKEMLVYAIFRPLIHMMISVSIGTILYASGVLKTGHLITLGTVIAYIDLVQKFYSPLLEFSEKFTILQSAMAGGERIFSLLDEKEEIPDRGERVIGTKLKEGISFENVSFGYGDGEPVLKELSFTIKRGEMVAVVGYTGSGKSTIINLLTRLWDPDKGRIVVDGIDIREIPVNRLRELIQQVQQDPFLFTGTIRDNILMGEGFTEEEIDRAAKVVQADRFLKRRSDGYDSEVQERGDNFSNGEKQLTSFTRTLIRNPDIIVLDEATAHVDSETESLLQEALLKLLEGRTSLIIAHRLSTIRHADRILVIHKGKLAEQGRHDELIEQRGIYYNLHKLQYKAH